MEKLKFLDRVTSKIALYSGRREPKRYPERLESYNLIKEKEKVQYLTRDQLRALWMPRAKIKK